MHWGLVSGTFHQPIPAASSLTCIWLICLIPPSFPAKPAQLPLIGRKPFVAAWNAPLDVCTTRYNVSIDLKIFHMHGSPRAVKTGQDVTIFYANRLGYYPFYTEQGTPVNGGLPQNCSLESHLRKASQDIRHYIPSGDFSGLAVIDWEYWRPQWSRNWHLKDIYRRKSRELIQGTYVNVTEAEVEELARHGFEDSATAFMRETLQLGTLTRPLGLWGFYLYPDCHNYHLHERNYTGSCPLLESIRNDELLWLWNSSTALFPSVAIRRRHTDSPSNLHFSRCRVRESLRIAGLPSLDYELPVFVYTRLCYRDEPLAFLTMDLIHTIGESAALGAAGFVIWGDLKMTSSRRSCLKVKSFVHRQLGRYIANVTRAAELCSRLLCRSSGRCARRDPEAPHYLHLSGASYRIAAAADGGFTVTGAHSPAERRLLAERFRCRCYRGYGGDRCDRRRTSGATTARASPALVLLLAACALRNGGRRTGTHELPLASTSVCDMCVVYDGHAAHPVCIPALIEYRINSL
ncbi:hyaluronidase-4-like isoform X2 [Brienomyrus brachyistius]|uniref:hyaluronidase-4-like isoform X2 n=1 Tax=Brienomyrus brachyistius TaxID=42636 RepID=UPI0020B1EE71|nr:hyaluronidase-4-like isoform X2 [Brienomyrus brachyistius]